MRENRKTVVEDEAEPWGGEWEAVDLVMAVPGWGVGCWIPGVPSSSPKSQRPRAFAWPPPSVSPAPCEPVQGAGGNK